jgi:putative NADH-flavin reductase
LRLKTKPKRIGMKILLIGATRGIGKALLETALEDNCDVTVLARIPEKITISHPQLRVVKGDVLETESIVAVASGHEAICSCIGVPITFKQVDLFSIAARNILVAVKQNPGQKYIAVTGVGAGDSKGLGGFLYDKIFKPLLLKAIYADKDREEEIIKSSGVDWMIVRPAGLTNGKRTGNYHIFNDMKGVTAKRISRLDVADFILKQLKNPTQLGKTPLLTY